MMKKSKRIISLILALLMLFTCIVGTLASCDGDKDSDDDNSTQIGVGNKGDGATIGYTVSVKTVGGRALEDVAVYTYADSTLKDLISFGSTDKNGRVTIDMERKDGYVAVLDRVPKGYNVAPYYEFKSGSADIVLGSSVILPETAGDYEIPASYKLGDIMYDFEVTTVDSVNPENVKVVRLSELLKTKKAVLINFWYSTCSPCISEFPYIDTVAKEYADDVAVICLNTYVPDTESSVATFKATNELSLDMAKADPALFTAFGTAGYPTNVMIDRFGTICLIEVGGLPSEKPFRKMFDYFSAAEYKQKIFTSLEELTPQEVPNITQPESSILEGVLNSGSISATYYPETDSADAAYSWPFINGTKDNVPCVYASNAEKDSSYAIMHVDVDMKAGDVLGFEYLSSTEENTDILYVLVDGEDIYQISGLGSQWKKCYPYVAKRDGTYKLSLVYTKDASVDEGDDTVYLKNFHITNKESIDVKTYIPYLAATRDENTGTYSYLNPGENVKFSAQDGYYHVCSTDSHTEDNGLCAGNCPLLLADLMGITYLSSDNSVYSWAYNGEIVIGTKNYYEDIVEYCSYASNGTISGLCTVNKELKSLLDVVIQLKGFDKSENEWLKVCKYYDTYCTDGPLADPIAGLAPHSAFDTVLSVDKNEYPNKVVYDGRVIMPRGLWYAFTPTTSGVYRVTSNSTSSVNGWIFSADKTELLVYDHVERFSKIPAVAGDPSHQNNNVSMVLYMEAGTTYYIDIAFYDVTQAGEFTFNVVYEAESLELFRSASPGGAFTYDVDENGNVGNTVIAGGIKVALDTESGYYRHVLDDESFGEYVFVDLVRVAGPFDKAIYLDPSLFKDGAVIKDLISLGAFNFEATETDRNGMLYLKLYALLGLREYAKTGTDSTLKAEIANNIAARELEALNLYFGSKSTKQEVINFLSANNEIENDKGELVSTVDASLKTLLDNYNNAEGDEALLAAENALISYMENLLTDTAKLKQLYAVGDDSALNTYVNDYVDSKLADTYFDNLSADMKSYLNNYVDNGLKAMWKDDYDFWYATYKMDDLKAGKTHGVTGLDYTDDIMSYVEKMLDDTNGDGVIDAEDGFNLPSDIGTVTAEAEGCVLVDAELARILQTLMDHNTFRNVTNSWTKLCYYYEYYGA
ncbi:MAG: TlpA family protein disulfide reductase [Clostridia bacterium]|nr:TlpA family protein disulfide reductase [Clostridia bacterium]